MELSQVSLEILHSGFRIYPQYTGHSPDTFVMEFANSIFQAWKIEMCAYVTDTYTLRSFCFQKGMTQESTSFLDAYF